jgi:hypothetical protein
MTRKEIEQPMDALARKFAATHDMKAKAENDRWNSELVKLDRPWVFVTTPNHTPGTRALAIAHPSVSLPRLHKSLS